MEHNQEKTWLREIKKDMNGKNKQARAQYLQEKLLKKNIDENWENIEKNSKLEGPLDQMGPKGSG